MYLTVENYAVVGFDATKAKEPGSISKGNMLRTHVVY